MTKNLLLYTLISCLLAGCAGNVPPPLTTVPISTASPVAAPIIAPTQAPTLTVAAIATKGPATGSQPTTSPVELVWSTTGNPNAFNTPDGLALDQQGNLYVTDSGNSRIQKFDSDGHFITMWGSNGSDNGQFDCENICMVAVDGQGNVYVTDIGNNRVQKFDSNGKFLTKWGSSGKGDGQFNDRCIIC